jgi:F-type H+-transporting ATPase subunit b
MRNLRRSALRRAAVQASLLLGLVLVAGFPAFSQESQHSEEQSMPEVGMQWKLINTAIFAALVAWFLAKKGPSFFNARSSDIQKAIKDATGLKIEADFRYSEADKRMAGLADEVARLREQGKAEMDREHQRVKQQTSHEIARIHQNAANEIEALRKEASDRVQLHTAQKALQDAEERLRSRFAQGDSDGLLADFVHLIERGKN